jgi:GT2 family glycosyltransferase
LSAGRRVGEVPLTSPCGPPKIVLLGIMSRKPVAGVVWQTLHYLLGLRRLGYDVYYVEAHGLATGLLMRSGEEGEATAAAFIDGVMRRFGLGDRWAFQAVYTGRRCYGLGEGELERLYASAELIINLHGATQPLPEHSESDRLVYLETDPVLPQVELYRNVQETIDFLEPHCAYFTFGENYGRPGCALPVSRRFEFRPTRQPVLVDLWQPYANGVGRTFSTVGSWRQLEREIEFRGEVYHWSKHYEFMKFLDLPARTNQGFELALNRYDKTDKRLLEGKGWSVRDALGVSMDPDVYRRYVAGSRGEFTVAKDQNVRLRTGWFSDRSATYLAAGRPVITQETGFSNILPTGEGLFTFSTMEQIVEAVESIDANYERHSRAASELAREYFSYDVVLSQLLAELGLSRSAGKPRVASSTRASEGMRDQTPTRLDENLAGSSTPFVPEMVLTPTSRCPTTLLEATVETVLATPAPVSSARYDVDTAIQAALNRVSIVILTFNNFVFTKLCLESLLANTEYPSYEVVVVDNGSTDGTPAYLRSLARRHPHIRAALNADNLGFARASNQGLAMATGDVLILLNNDTLVPQGWLTRLVRHLEDPGIGLVGPVTNRIGNEAQIEVSYRTYGEFVRFAREYTRAHEGELFDIRMLAMFCLAMRRDVHERLGPLDERFEVGMLEDDDYAMRAQAAGYRVVCAEDVFVHHFGGASFGKLVPTGEYGELLRANRHQFEEKWSIRWEPYHRRPSERYQLLVGRIREVVRDALPPASTVIVVSKGDDELLDLNGKQAWHFPQTTDGVYAGYHPADSAEAIAHLEALRTKGGDYLLFPGSAFWWLEHYSEFDQYLWSRYRVALHEKGTCMIFELREAEIERPDTVTHDNRASGGN